MRKLIFNLHLTIAVAAGAFMVVLGVSGSVMEFEPELDRSLHPQLSYITPGTHVLSLREMGYAVSRTFPGEPVVAYLPSLSPRLSSQVLLPRGIAYVNQYTGQILGVRERGQTFLGFMRAIHTRLAGGDIGRGVLKWSGVAMLLSLGSGLYLWWPIKRLSIRRKWGGRRLWFDLHNAIGIFALLPLAILTATGTVLGFEDQLAPVIYKLTRSSPMEVTRMARTVPAPGATLITPDDAVEIARSCMPGAIPYRVQMPKYGGFYQIALIYPQDKVAGDRNVVTLEPYGGRVISMSRSSDLSRGDRILAISEALHTGNILGMPGRVVAWLTSTLVLLQAASGLLMWLYRNRIVPAAKVENAL